MLISISESQIRILLGLLYVPGMDEEVSIAGLRAEQTARRASMMLRVQSIMILLLFLWITEEYNHNEYFQGWAAKSLGMFGFLLGGTLTSVYAGILIVLYLNPPMPPETRRKTEKLELVVVSSKNRRQGS